MDAPARAAVRREFLWFAAAGLVGFAVDGALFLFMHDAYGWSIVAARSVSASCAIVTTWILNRRLTFTTRRSRLWGAELVRYTIGQGAGLLVNLGSFTLALMLIPQLRSMAIVALGLGAGAALLFNFVTARTLVFRSDAE
jgi:putative flippase GtrA